MKKIILSVMGALFLVLAGTGCAAKLSEEPASPDTALNLSVLENEVGGADPIEGANRVMFCVTDVCMDYIIDFIGRIYCTILPRPVVDGLDNVCVNLEFPSRVISCLLSAEWRGAGDETVRFFANSIIGIAGIFDVAGAWWGFYSTESNFGQAFAAWGIDPGCTLTLPLMYPINVRDTVGSIFDAAFDIKTYIPYCGYITTINRLVVAQRDYIPIVEGSEDRYKTYRQLVLAYREIRQRKTVYHLRNARYSAEKEKRKAAEAEAELAAKEGREPVVPPPPPLPQAPPRPEGLKGEWLSVPELNLGTPAQQSMLSLHFRPRIDDDFWFCPLSFFNRDFERSGSRRRLALFPDRPRGRYCFWKQPEPKPEDPPRQEKLALILPGIGGAWNTSGALALAELFYQDGYSVATFDSAFNWHFIVSTNSSPRLPGFLPEDAAAVKMVLAAALEDMHERGDIREPRIVLAGYSMGGMHALKIAATDRKFDTLKIARVIAINPPAELGNALERADAFAVKSGRYSPREAVDKIVEIGGYLLAGRRNNIGLLNSRQEMPPPLGAPDAPHPEVYRLPLSPDDAECLMGLNLRTALRSVLAAVHRECPVELIDTPFALLDRNEMYRKIDAIDLKTYAGKILAGQYPGSSLEELLRLSGLRSAARALAADPRIRVIHSWNDPLLTSDDARFLDRTFGKRIVWVSGGGHLGNLSAWAVQKKIIELAEPEKKISEQPAPPVGTK
jgi:phospholipid-binding lipoprotein MlaA